MTEYERLFDITKTKIFNDIFNYSDLILKNNIKLSILNGGKFVRSMYYTAAITLLLPDTINDYYLYICESSMINNLLYGVNLWENMENILNTRRVNLDIMSSEHKMIPKELVYGILDKGGMTIFAINRNVIKKLNTTSEMYLVVNIDSDLVNERTVIHHLPGYDNNVNGLITRFDTANQDKCIGIINGHVIRNDLFKTYGNLNTDWYELYVDENIQFSFVVDLDNRKTYLSSEENLYKDIILIPKDLSQDKVYTFDTISAVVRTKEGKGIFIPYFAKNSVSQLTYNCFSISSFVIDAALDKLGVTTGELLIIVNNYSKSNVHIENGSLTQQLYSLPDTEIKTLIDGTGNNDVEYWLADNLEKRMYAKYLTEIEEMDTYDQTLIRHQIECLGYYPFVQLLCTHNVDLTNLSSPLSSLIIDKPEFWEGTDLVPIFHLDGNKIAQDRYTVTQDTNHLSVSFDVPIVPDFSYSVLNYDLILQEELKSKKIIVETTSNLVIPKYSGTLHVFLKTENTVKNIDGSDHFTYLELAIENNSYYSVVEYEDQYIFTFKNLALSHEFIFEYDSVTSINSYPNVDLTDGKTLFFIPYTKDSDGNHIQSLVENDYEIYLNGRFMVKDIDCCVITLKNNEEIAGYSIILQNLKFLNDTGSNSVDIIITNRKTITSDIGYVVDGIIPKTYQNEAWIEGVSRLFINGKLIPFNKVIQHKTHFEIDPSYTGNGYIYQFINTVSNDFYKMYEGFMYSEYFAGRLAISNYLTKDYTYEYPDTIIIQYGNKIFSSYLNEVIRRILDNEITVSFIQDDNDIIHQLDSISYLKKFDNIFREESKLDKRFIDIYPGYLASLTVTDLQKYLYIQRLVKIILGGDAATDYLTVYTG